MHRTSYVLSLLLSFCWVPAALAQSDWKSMTAKGCGSMSIVDAQNGFLLQGRSVGGFKLHKLDSNGDWDAGTNVTIGSLLFAQDVSDMHWVDANTGYIVGPSKTVYKTTDGGTTWSGVDIAVSGGQSKFLVQQIDFGSKTHGVAIGRYGALVADKPLIAITSDGGASWKDVAIPADCKGISAAGMAGSSTLVIGGLRAAAAAAVWTSTDSGANWTKRNITAKGVVDIDFLDDNIGFVVSYPPAGAAVTTNEQVIATTDGGKTWTSPSGGVIPVQIISAAWVDAQNGYVAGRSAGNNALAIARTKDGGKTWALDTLPSDTEYQAANLHVTCFEYPGPVAYAGLNSGKARFLKNENAGGKRPDRYGAAPTADMGTLSDMGGGADAGTNKEMGAPPVDSGQSTMDAATKADAGTGSKGDDGGCAVATDGGGSLVMLLLALFALFRRRSLRAGR